MKIMEVFGRIKQLCIISNKIIFPSKNALKSMIYKSLSKEKKIVQMYSKFVRNFFPFHAFDR